MSVQEVAKAAGVSASTVSRVINQHPSVAASTADAVRRTMQRLNFTPNPRALRFTRPDRRLLDISAIAFLVLGTDGSTHAPAFEGLLRGVSTECERQAIQMTVSFISNKSTRPIEVGSRRIDGLLLHGAKPDPTLAGELKKFPSVWLMANRQRPEWGDQVMPDNTLIGDIAARYLCGAGHKKLAYLGVSMASPDFMVRRLSFSRTAESFGAEAAIVIADERRGDDYWNSSAINETAQNLVNGLGDNPGRPTGLFVSEDRLLHPVFAALRSRGIRIGKGGDVEVVSCNNEQQHLVGLTPIPATIDIRAESIGCHGVEQLIWRLGNRDRIERIRLMVEPKLVPSHDEMAPA